MLSPGISKVYCSTDFLSQRRGKIVALAESCAPTRLLDEAPEFANPCAPHDWIRYGRVVFSPSWSSLGFQWGLNKCKASKPFRSMPKKALLGKRQFYQRKLLCLLAAFLEQWPLVLFPFSRFFNSEKTRRLGYWLNVSRGLVIWSLGSREVLASFCHGRMGEWFELRRHGSLNS